MRFRRRSVPRALKKWWILLSRRRGHSISSALRIGIAARLAIAFAGVAALAVAANLFAEHGLTIASLTSGRAPAPSVSSARWLRDSVARASGAVSGAVNGFDRAIETRVRLSSSRASAMLAEAAGDLDREMRAYVSAARAFAEPMRVEDLARKTRAHLDAGAALVRDADQRRALSTQYTAILDSITRRVQDSVDASWNLFGRLVARRSLVELNRELESIRLQSARLLAGDSSEGATLDALNESDARFLSLVQTYRSEFVRTAGQQWLDQLLSDVDRLRSIRAELGARDRRSVAGLSEFRTAGFALVGAIHALDTSPPEKGGAAGAGELKQDGSVLAAKLNDEGRALLWISAIVLLLVLLLSIATTLSIVRPVRRFISAMGQLAHGNSSARMTRGGIKEIDALAVAFNHMAEKIASYQGQLESTVTERTLQFRHLEEHDPLTQLPNRRQLLRYLREALQLANAADERVAVLFIDLDNFKTINDSMGHLFGDRVLVAIAQRIRDAVGPGAFVARLGGDEFTVIYDPARTDSEPAQICSRLLQSFATPVSVDGHELSIGTSVGASIFPDDADNAEALLRAADAALFHAKASGRRQFSLFSPALLEDVSIRFRIEQGLRHAIDRGEFELFFQPEVSLQTLSTSVLEALLRWRMPDGTYTSPGRFLPVAEQSGLILEIGDWVLHRAIKTTAGWYQAGRSDVRVAINVSARQLLAHGFVRRILALLESERLPPVCIELELTENVLQTDPATIDVLRVLREHDIAVALDDFGTGYSSLASLEQLPLTRVKLDRSLISGIHTSPRSLAIAQSIMDLCRRLGLEVTAEGVEDLPQLATLWPQRALHVQGFLIARPVPAEQVLPLMKTMRARMNALFRHVRSSDASARIEGGDPSSSKVVRLPRKKDRN